MLSLGIGEILVIAALLLVVVGPDRLPKAMRWAGRQYGQLRRAADDMRRAFVLEADRQDADDRYQNLQKRRAEMKAAREAAHEAAGEGTQAADVELPEPDVAPVEEVTTPPEQADEPSTESKAG